ncbi:MAG: hypothetical protein EPO32_12530 [Anaerolineae bacterium]|nr:MAG: hypothetical protein EPO32_12530 [Anaerolineae bacterium]
MQIKLERPRFKEWIIWIVASSILFGLAGSFFHFPGDNFPPGSWQFSERLSAGVFGFILGAVTGAVIGGLQSIVLRLLRVGVRGWWWATALGAGVAHGLRDGAEFFDPEWVAALVSGVVISALYLRAARNISGDSRVWFGLCLGGWLAAWWLATIVENQFRFNYLPWNPMIGLLEGFSFSLVFGLVFALFTGAGLFGYFRKAES